MIYEKGCKCGYSNSGGRYCRIYGLFQNETERKKGAQKQSRRGETGHDGDGQNFKKSNVDTRQKTCGCNISAGFSFKKRKKCGIIQ